MGVAQPPLVERAAETPPFCLLPSPFSGPGPRNHFQEEFPGNHGDPEPRGAARAQFARRPRSPRRAIWDAPGAATGVRLTGSPGARAGPAERGPTDPAWERFLSGPCHPGSLPSRAHSWATKARAGAPRGRLRPGTETSQTHQSKAGGGGSPLLARRARAGTTREGFAPSIAPGSSGSCCQPTKFTVDVVSCGLMGPQQEAGRARGAWNLLKGQRQMSRRDGEGLGFLSLRLRWISALGRGGDPTSLSHASPTSPLPGSALRLGRGDCVPGLVPPTPPGGSSCSPRRGPWSPEGPLRFGV